MRAWRVKYFINKTKITKMKGMFTKLSIITPSEGRLSYNLKELLQMDPSTGGYNFMIIG